MKSTIKSFIVMLVLLIICGCSKSPTVYQKEEFLSDMAEGINERLLDTSTSTENDYRRLIDSELKKISKYDGGFFSDEEFGKYAQAYIDAVKLQERAVDNYKKQDLFNALWYGGRMARAGLIVYMYENYSLNLTEEQVNGYRTPDVTYNISGPGVDLFSNFNNYTLTENDIQILETKGSYVTSYGRTVYEMEFTIKNNSSHTLYGILVNCQLLDESGNVIRNTASPHFKGELEPGKTTTIKCNEDKQNITNGKTIELLSISYDTDGNSFYTDTPISKENREKYNFDLSE